MEQAEIASRYVILIGINVYRENDKVLKGCVRDVQEIKTYIEATLNPIHIRIFTASPTEKESSPPLAEEPRLWPTYDNIVSSLKQIKSSARPNDLLYIHFSGHGTTIPSSGDLALPLLVVTENIGLRYLRGLELAHIIKEMAEKGLIVTLVLDCCFSGSVARKDSRVRYLDYDPDVDAAYPLNPNLGLGIEAGATPSAYRNASMRPNWLVNPDQYIILTACGPTETAQEIILNGQNHGLLSYTLLRTFKKLGGVGGKQQHIYHHLCAKFKEAQDKRRYKQNPMFYGEKSLCFFGRDNPEEYVAPIPIIKKRDGGIQLEAGQAHGICDGDRFVINPIKLETNYPTLNPNSVITIVTHTRDLTADMEIIERSSPYFETGWLATPVTRLSLRQFPIRLELSLPYRDEWTIALREQQSLDIYDGNSTKHGCPFSFYVAMESDNEYQVRDEVNQQIVHIPVITTDQEAARYVLDIVKHLARFKLVKNLANTSLANPDHPFTNSFTIQLIDRAGKRYHPGCLRKGWLHQGCLHPECVIEIQDGDWLEMVVENTRESGGGNLYLHIYNMGSCWEIENILEGNHAAISSTKGEWREKIEMTLPDEIKKRGQSQCEDIIKVFLTAKSTSFTSLELPGLATPANWDKSFGTREGGVESLSDDWAAFNFRIRIFIK